MDNTPQKSTGIPRLSKLPRPPSAIPKPGSTLPRPSSALRTSPSKETLTGSLRHSVRNVPADSKTPKLRSAASTDQLRTDQSTGTTRTHRLRTSISRDHLRSSTNGASSPSTPRASRPPPLSGALSRLPATPSRRSSTTFQSIPDEDTHIGKETTEANDVLIRRPLTLTRRPSESSFSVTSQDYLDSSGRNDDEAAPSASTEENEEPETVQPRPLRSRPSLSERTMETLAGLPSSPALNRKKSSSFFDQGRAGPRSSSRASRPGSSYSDYSDRAPSRSSRPGSSGGNNESRVSTFRTSNALKTPLATIKGTPDSRQTTRPEPRTPSLRKSSSRISLSTASKLPPAGSMTSSGATKSPTTVQKSYGHLSSQTGIKPMVSKANATKTLLRKPSLAGPGAPDPDAAWDGAIAPANSGSHGVNGANGLGESASPGSYRKSSAALRDQIAKAKAAKKATTRQSTAGFDPSSSQDMPIVPSDEGFDFGMDHNDPFNLKRGESSSKKVIQQRINSARTTGRLNIAALELKEIPIDVTKMYDLDSIGTTGGSWAESVDMTRFVAADNELEMLSDEMFPDNTGDVQDDSNDQGNIFGGLETLDLHGNLLVGIPLGFRHLSHLTSLNLSSNRLMNDSLETIGQMTSLRDLKLAKNLLLGPLRSELSGLTDLEILDLQGNTISALPYDIYKLTRLRILNLSENSIDSLSFEALSRLPLTELLVRKNKLNDTLIAGGVESLPHLQTLDVSANQLTRLVPLGSAISLPELHVLSLSMNRLQGLPDMTSWSNLLTLTVDENAISSIPNSFMALEKLKHADFSSNDIRVIPPEISRMSNLSLMRLSGNPLRDKKFVSMSTEELKEALSARLEPPPPYQEPGTTAQAMVPDFLMNTKTKNGTLDNDDRDDDSRSDDDFATPPTSAPHSPSRSRSHTLSSVKSRSHTLSNQTWPVKQGLLDRSRTELSALHPVVCSKVATEHQVKQVHLQHNLFSSIPNSLSFFASTLVSLSMSHNQLVGQTYLAEDLEFPALKELNLSSNRVTSLDPLLMHLHAPLLEKLDISINRINSLPVILREVFPSLSILLVSTNQIIDLDPETIRGLKIVDASNNEISHLNPRIGLLGGPGGLERLDVMGNRFRVPRWNVLERGTEATLRWLRGRVPVAEMAAWKGDGGEDEEIYGDE